MHQIASTQSTDVFSPLVNYFVLILFSSDECALGATRIRPISVLGCTSSLKPHSLQHFNNELILQGESCILSLSPSSDFQPQPASPGSSIHCTKRNLQNSWTVQVCSFFVAFMAVKLTMQLDICRLVVTQKECFCCIFFIDLMS